MPLDWLEGEFLQTNVIQWKEADNVVDEGIQIAPEIIDGILRAKGQNIPIKQYDARFNAMKAVFDKVDEYNKKHPNDEFDSQKIFSRGMFDPKFRNSRVFKLGRKYNKAWSDFKPLADTVDEFIRLSNFAGNNGTNLKTPIYTESSNLINIFSSPKLEGEVVNIFRFVTNQLGSLPFLPTLKSTLELADAPETKALREQIDNWSQSINKGTASVTEMIQKDIKKANKSLERSSSIRKAGFITGLVAIPISMIGMASPFLSAIGLGLSCVAVICEVSGVKKAEKVKWVGFGSRRTK